MKLFSKFLIGVYIVGITIMAIPTIHIMLTDEQSEPLSLEASGSDEQWEFLKDVSKFIVYADEMGYKMTAGEMYRTMYQQRYYVAHGLSWTYNSKHLKRRAFDFNLFVNGKYVTNKENFQDLADYWESLSPKNRSGIRFSDFGHIERR